MKLLSAFILLFAFQFASAQEWKAVKNAPVVKYRFDDIYFINDSTGWAINGSGEIFKTNGKDKPWVVQFYAGKYLRSIEFIDDTTGFVGSVDSAFYMTTNAGQDWTRIDKTKSFNVPGICGISHWGDAVILTGAYFGSPYVMKSSDRGKTWSYQDMSGYTGGVTGGLVDVWYKSQDTVFVSGTTANHLCIVLRSADAGSTWTDVTPKAITMPSGWGWKLHFPTPSVGYLAIEEVTISDVPTSNSTHFLKTTDGGRSWHLKEVKIGKNIDLQGLGFANANRGWIGGWSTGMYETNDGGETWSLINNFSNLNRFFFLRSDFGYVSGTTIFNFRKSLITAVQPVSQESQNAHSLEIYPNPGNRETFATVSLATNTMVVLSLLDINGKTVKEIHRGYTESGTYTYPIDMAGLSSGEYIVILLTHEHFLGKRLLKIKN